MQRKTPAMLSAFGVTLVCSSCPMERPARRRASSVYVCFTRASGRGGVVMRLGGLVVRLPALVVPDGLDLGLGAAALHPGEPRAGDDDQADARGDVEPEVVAGRHHREPDPARPQGPENARP